MIFKITLGCIILLAFMYYVGVVLQCFFPGTIRITKRNIKFLGAIVPFYYWIVGSESGDEKEDETNENINI